MVFVEAGEGRFEPTPITIAGAFDGQMEVAEGLEEGDRIATRGAFTLKGELLKDELGEEE